MGAGAPTSWGGRREGALPGRVRKARAAPCFPFCLTWSHADVRAVGIAGQRPRASSQCEPLPAAKEPVLSPEVSGRPGPVRLFPFVALQKCESSHFGVLLPNAHGFWGPATESSLVSRGRGCLCSGCAFRPKADLGRQLTLSRRCPCLSVLMWWGPLGSFPACQSLCLCTPVRSTVSKRGSWSPSPGAASLSLQVRRAAPVRSGSPPGGAPGAGGVADDLRAGGAEGVRQRHLPSAGRLQVPPGGLRWVCWVRYLQWALCPHRAAQALTWFCKETNTWGLVLSHIWGDGLWI